MKYLILTVAIVFLSVSPVMGEAITGAQFLQKCSAVEKANKGPVNEAETVYATFCLGYITGFVDHYDVLDYNNKLKNKDICLASSDKQITNTLLVKIVLDFLKKNPEYRNRSIGRVVSQSLEEAFPCE